jgi:hypothetical protein
MATTTAARPREHWIIWGRRTRPHVPVGMLTRHDLLTTMLRSVGRPAKLWGRA